MLVTCQNVLYSSFLDSSLHCLKWFVAKWPWVWFQNQELPIQQSVLSIDEPDQDVKCELDHLTIPNDGMDVWEIDPKHLKFGSKIASGSYGDLWVYVCQNIPFPFCRHKTLSDYEHIFLIWLAQLTENFLNRFKGTYCSQEVAIKVLKAENVNSDLQREFSQEVYIMRFVLDLYLLTFGYLSTVFFILSICIV